MTYRVEVEECEGRDGRFKAMHHGAAVVSANPEHDWCHEATKAGLPDGPVEFIRDGIVSLTHSSIHAMGKLRIALGESFPQRVKRRNFNGERGGVIRDGQTPSAGTQQASDPITPASALPGGPP